MPHLVVHISWGFRLLLPASLSKQDRALWHGLADKAGLQSHSEVGPARPATPYACDITGPCRRAWARSGT